MHTLMLLYRLIRIPSNRLVIPVVVFVLANSFGCDSRSESPTPTTDPQTAAANTTAVKTEFMHAWTAYRQYAWGHDQVRPLSRTAYDWYGSSLYITPVDALDTLILMGFTSEANDTRALINSNLSFDKDIMVKTFEINIRVLGGLL